MFLLFPAVALEYTRPDEEVRKDGVAMGGMESLRGEGRKAMLQRVERVSLRNGGAVRGQFGRLFTAALILGVLLVGPSGHRRMLAWIAELEQPCHGPDICGFHLEVTTASGNIVLGELDVPAEGCGTHRVDISALLAGAGDPGLGLPQLRVWSVNCSGILSTSYDWVIVDVDPECLGRTSTSHDGRANHDAVVDISDPIYLMTYLFLGGPRPCSNSADANNDGSVDLSDAIFILQMLFDH